MAFSIISSILLPIPSSLCQQNQKAVRKRFAFAMIQQVCLLAFQQASIPSWHYDDDHFWQVQAQAPLALALYH